MTGAVRLRAATAADAEALAEAHVRAWQAAYRGLMPQDLLDGLDVATRAAVWRRAIDEPATGSTLVVATVDDAVAGFALYGPARDEDAAGDGELWVINVRPDEWSAGIGSALVRAAHEALAAYGHSRAILWVVLGNARARRFYERHGWTADGAERTIEIRGVTVPEVRYARALP